MFKKRKVGITIKKKKKRWDISWERHGKKIEELEMGEADRDKISWGIWWAYRGN